MVGRSWLLPCFLVVHSHILAVVNAAILVEEETAIEGLWRRAVELDGAMEVNLLVAFHTVVAASL